MDIDTVSLNLSFISLIIYDYKSLYKSESHPL